MSLGVMSKRPEMMFFFNFMYCRHVLCLIYCKQFYPLLLRREPTVQRAKSPPTPWKWNGGTTKTFPIWKIMERTVGGFSEKRSCWNLVAVYEEPRVLGRPLLPSDVERANTLLQQIWNYFKWLSSEPGIQRSNPLEVFPCSLAQRQCWKSHRSRSRRLLRGRTLRTTVCKSWLPWMGSSLTIF